MTAWARSRHPDDLGRPEDDPGVKATRAAQAGRPWAEHHPPDKGGRRRACHAPHTYWVGQKTILPPKLPPGESVDLPRHWPRSISGLHHGTVPAAHEPMPCSRRWNTSKGNHRFTFEKS